MSTQNKGTDDVGPAYREKLQSAAAGRRQVERELMEAKATLENRLAEQTAELRESEERLRIAKEAAKLGIHDFNVATGALRWDKRLREIWAIGPDDPVDYDVFMAGIHPDDRARVQEEMDRALDHGGDHEFYREYRVIGLGDGELRWVVATGTVFFEGSKPVRLVGTAQDISARKRAEQALRDSEAHFHSVLDSSRDLIYRANLQTCHFDYISPSAEAVVSYSTEELLAQNPEAIWRFIHPDDLPAMHRAMARALEIGDSEAEYRQLSKNGEYRWLSNRISIIRDADGRPLYRDGSIRDITERKNAEAERERLLTELQKRAAEAEAAVRVRDEFISVAAHELKTPVTSLQGFAQLTLRDLETKGTVAPDRLAKSMERIERQARRLAKLTDQLLSLSRLQSGKFTLSKEITDLSLLTQRVIADIRESHPTRTIELNTGGVCEAELDTGRIEQVLVNLIDNALKFSPADSRIEVTLAEAEPGWAELSVRDWGMGVPEEKHSLIFERFYQAHAEKHFGGMGIGLFVSREMVEMHGGTISIEQPEDGGSRFVVHLPLSGEKVGR